MRVECGCGQRAEEERGRPAISLVDCFASSQAAVAASLNCTFQAAYRPWASVEEAAPTLESLHPLVLRLVQQGVRFATHSYSVGAGGTGGHGGGGGEWWREEDASAVLADGLCFAECAVLSLLMPAAAWTLGAC